MDESHLTESRQRIMVELRVSGEMSIDEMSSATGLSKTATRAHLVRMERDGVVVRVQRARSEPGRPPAVFQLTQDGASMFPTDDGDVLTRLLGFLEAEGARALVVKFFEELWEDRMRELLHMLDVPSLDAVSLDARVAALDATLRKTNFMPVIQIDALAQGKLITVSECNCPFPATVRGSGAPCKLEIEFLSRVLGAPLKSAQIACSREEVCTFEFELAEAG